MTEIDEAERKKEKLFLLLKELGSLAVAFSGGVDSTFLLSLAQKALGENIIAVTAKSAIHPNREIEESARFASSRNIRHIIFPSNEMSSKLFVSNGKERCYHCKKHLAYNLLKIARENNIYFVAHGANVDDRRDYRPGTRATDEAGILAPLSNAGLGKKEIRFLSKKMNLPTYSKPSAACLASRVPYGKEITIDKLKMIEAAEEFLLERDFKEIRVRHHDSVARIEVGSEEIDKIMDQELRMEIADKFLKLGFKYIAVDIEGYRSGKMNREI